jgi:7,8-dihydropterin-6-yl-methyl-4-(beta-D-ribofuranosyl)aminobenzene 5'-phosphate synthase
MSLPRVKITILVDNKSADGLLAEHGLSFWIEVDGKRILFDTGQKDALAVNSRMLGVDLSRTDLVVLSHGHYDHTGAIPYVLGCAPCAHVYLHAAAFLPRYSVRDKVAKPIQMPADSMSAVMNLDDEKIHYIAQHTFPLERVGITGPIPRETDFEDTGGPFFLDPIGLRPDPIEDDLALWIQTEDGLVVCVGCCHGGLVNTMRRITDITGERRIRALMGGFHLSNADMDRLKRTAAALREYDIAALIPCHCTGDGAVEYFKKHLDCPVQAGHGGFSLNVP